jgi:TldD protein
VFDGYAMASLVARTLGEPSEIDRILGFEANASGTSYLATAAEAAASLGVRQLGPAVMNIRANRSMPGGAATVKWDDEGVAPDEFDLIRHGVVTDYPTSRQHVGVMQEYYRAHGQPLRSHGCSGSGTALDFPAVVTPNLVMVPSATSASFDALVSDLADGYAVKGGDWSMDQQGLTGQWSGRSAMVYRVKRGKLLSPVGGMGLLIRSPELWKNLVAVGDASSVETKGFRASKGQPAFSYAYSVSAPAARVSGLAVTDLRRRLDA